MLLNDAVIALAGIAYLGLLFGIAWHADRRADQGRSLIDRSLVYALSLAVYTTSWTYYGSVGRAAAGGVGFLPIYLGPTLVVMLGWVVLRKMIRISKAQRITSIADFIAARYGKSALLGGLVTVIAVVGVIPYIALQLKAVSGSVEILLQYPAVVMPPKGRTLALWQDTALYAALLLAAFTMLFGTRHLDASERHEGMVAAIAFESVVKLVAFLAVGLFVTYGVYAGFGDLFERAEAVPRLAKLMTLDGQAATWGSWGALVLLSALSFLFLPRQFQVGVVENVDERHVARAMWLLPLYLLAINIFVLPITMAGLLQFPAGQVDADTFVLTLPMAHQQQALALLVFIGGLSAATGMVIVETIALSTMICNDLVMPVLLRWQALGLQRRDDLTRLLLGIRRGAIVLLMMLGYLYYRAAGEAYALVSIGLISFAAVAQFAPAMLGGMYWRRATRRGALAALCAGFGIWAWTLLVPAFAKSGWLPFSLVQDGPGGIGLLRPTALFGLSGFDEISHALFWSMLANIGCFVGVSLATRPSLRERGQAELFVNALQQEAPPPTAWRGRASVQEVAALLGRFLGPQRAQQALADYAGRRGLGSPDRIVPDADLVRHCETLLAGTIGTASARVMVASAMKEEPLGMDEVLHILDETQQVIAYSHRLEQKSQELEAKSRELEVAGAELRAANARLTELDRMKDDFISTVTHELRTPLTSIRAMSEILQARTQMEPAQRQQFIGIIVSESERLTRLINQVLDLAKLESGGAEWHATTVDLPALLREAADATDALVRGRGATLALDLPAQVPGVQADRDRLMQVLLNLIGNAVKFCPDTRGRIRLTLSTRADHLEVAVADNGIGIAPEHHHGVFEKFRQVGDSLTGKPQGTGLGLPISREIIRRLGGRLWVDSAPGAGATFRFTLPTGGMPAGGIPPAPTKD
ncbi:MAG: ATP-binding protein [Aquabacterium sp.]